MTLTKNAILEALNSGGSLEIDCFGFTKIIRGDDVFDLNDKRELERFIVYLETRRKLQLIGGRKCH